jgi:hypothetical protein
MSMRSSSARFAACTALGWIALGGASAVASAHAEFESTSVTASSTTQVVLDVPHERAPKVFNTTVRIQIPSGWSSPTCTSPAGWTCSSSSGEVAFYKTDPGSIVDSSEVFGFALSAPASAGTATFPVAQIYDTGENVLWSSSAQLQVTSGQAPTTSAPQPSPSPTAPNGPPTTTTQSESSNAGSGTDGGSSASTALSPDSSNTVTLQADQTEDLVGAHSTSTSDDAPILAIVVAVIVVIIVGGAAFALARRRGR